MPRYPAGYFSKAKQIEVAALRRAMKTRGMETAELSDEELWGRLQKADDALQELMVQLRKVNAAVEEIHEQMGFWLRD